MTTLFCEGLLQMVWYPVHQYVNVNVRMQVGAKTCPIKYTKIEF